MQQCKMCKKKNIYIYILHLNMKTLSNRPQNQVIKKGHNMGPL